MSPTPCTCTRARRDAGGPHWPGCPSEPRAARHRARKITVPPPRLDPIGRGRWQVLVMGQLPDGTWEPVAQVRAHTYPGLRWRAYRVHRALTRHRPQEPTR